MCNTLPLLPTPVFFAPGSSEIAVGYILSLYLLVQNLSQLHMHIVIIQFSSVQFRRSVVSDSLRPHESQHARPPCPSPTPEFKLMSHTISLYFVV